ncbi:MAG: tetratricopeptide repeat protein [Myxococcota bacterium]|nr:tetratricopeptide repeat protein [Myxococcota bacterium]
MSSDSMELRARCLAVADGLLWAILLLSPLAVGTVHVESWAVAALLALAAFGLTLLGTSVMDRPPRLLLGVFLLWGLGVVLPLLPLPTELVAWLSPESARLWSLGRPGEAGGPGWHPVHQAPGEGAFQLLRWIAASAFAFACVQRAADPLWRKRLPRVLILAAVLAGGVCLVQTVSETSHILGLYRPRTPWEGFWRAPMVNPNHWTAYLSMAAVLGLGRGLAPGQGARGPALLAGLAGLALALLVCFSPSRGGLLGLGLGCAVLLLLLFLGRPPSGAPRRSRTVGISIGLLAALLLALSTWAAIERSEVRADPYSGDLVGGLAQEGRLALIPVAGDVLAAHPVTGVGRGALYDVFPRFRAVEGTALARWVEVLPVDLLVDFGAFLGTGLLLALSLVLLAALAGGRKGAAEAGAAAALLGLAVHELGDFSTETGAVLFAAVGLAVLVLPPREARGAGRRQGLALLLGLVLLSLLALPALHHSDSARCVERTRQQVAEGGSWAESTVREWSRHPASFPFALAVAAGAEADEDPARALAWLNRAQVLAPFHPEPHLRTARLLRRLGADSQALVEYRLAMEGDWRFRARPIFREVARAYSDTASLRRLVPEDRPEAIAQFAMWLRDLGDPRGPLLGREAVETLPEQPAVLVAGIYARLEEGRHEEARELIERAWKISDLDPHIRLRLAVSMGWAGDIERELALLRSMESGVDRDWPTFWFSLARAEFRADNGPASRRALRRLMRSGLPRWSSEALLMEARIEEREGRAGEALRLVQRSRRIDSSRAEPFAMEARLLQDRGRREEALVAAERALQLDPTNGTARKIKTAAP